MKAGTRVRVVTHHHLYPNRIGMVCRIDRARILGTSITNVLVKFEDGTTGQFLEGELKVIEGELKHPGPKVRILKPKPGTEHKFAGRIGILVAEEEDYFEVKLEGEDSTHIFYIDEVEIVQ